MQQSTWNDTNQHWVPQFLLRGFGIKGNTSRVWELDKQTGSTRICRVKDVASKPKLLSERDDTLMRKLESRANRPIQSIRKGNLRIRDGDRNVIDQLVAAMMMNDPYGIDYQKTRREVIESTSRSVKEDMEYWGGTIETRTLEEFVGERFNHDYLTIALEGGNGIVLSMLRLMGLRAVYSQGGEWFVVGDSPILAVRSRGEDGPSLLNPGSQVILPIGWECVLVYDWVTGVNLVDHGGTVESEQVLSLYKDYCYESNCRCLYGRNEESLIREEKLTITWDTRQRSTQVNNGWSVMQQYLAESQAAEMEMNKQNAWQGRLAAREVVRRAAREREANE